MPYICFLKKKNTEHVSGKLELTGLKNIYIYLFDGGICPCKCCKEREAGYCIVMLAKLEPGIILPTAH